ncbi:hypothetical protein YC2023_039730 [Brassica napus]
MGYNCNMDIIRTAIQLSQSIRPWSCSFCERCNQSRRSKLTPIFMANTPWVRVALATFPPITVRARMESLVGISLSLPPGNPTLDHDKAHTVNYHTTETIYTFEKRIGRTEEIAYDLKSSQMTDYVRTKVTLNIENPTTASKILLLLSG